MMIVAECGCNWNGDRARIPEFIQAAKNAGATHVKFQAYSTDKLVARRGITAADMFGAEPLIGFLRRNELTDADLDLIAAESKRVSIPWFCSVFDPSQVERVLSRGACALKIGHKEADWQQLIDACDGLNPLFISFPRSPEWTDALPDNATFVYCVAEYPAERPPQLGRVHRSHQDIGFSSHYKDWRIPAAAALRGATYIEAHFYINAEEPEQPWSLHCSDFAKMAAAVKEYATWL